MAHSRFLTEYQRDQIKSFQKEGLSSNAIAQRMENHDNYIKQYIADKTYENRPKLAGNTRIMTHFVELAARIHDAAKGKHLHPNSYSSTL